MWATNHERVTLLAEFDEIITQGLQEDLQKEALKRTNKLIDSYFKKILKKEDAKITIKMNIQKDDKKKYLGNFHFKLDKNEFERSNDVPFKKPDDVVSHAFKRLKEHMSKGK